MKRILALGVILLFIGSISSSTGFNLEKQSNIPISNGKTLYVGGSGPGNYSKIQDAIDNTSDGDTVFVYNGTYYENVIVNKSINLIGEDMNTTVVQCENRTKSVFTLMVHGITLTGFSMQTNFTTGHNGIDVFSDYNIISGNTISLYFGSGIALQSSDYNKVAYNIIINCSKGILIGEFNPTLNYSNHNNISFNYIKNSTNGIYLKTTFHNSVYKNICVENRGNGIWMGNSVNNTISYNILSRNKHIAGLTAWFCYDNNFIWNNFTDNDNMGLYIRIGGNNRIIQNNFINNTINAEFRRHFRYEFIKKTIIETIKLLFTNEFPDYNLIGKNIWDNNYWDEQKSSPHPIKGYIDIFMLDRLRIPWFNFDRNPAQEPYDIEV